MANCGVKRDQRSSYVHFRKHRRMGLFENINRRFAEQRLQSCLSNGVGFDVRFGRATISGVEKNLGSQRMSIKMNPDLFTQTAREGSGDIRRLRRNVRFVTKLSYSVK